MRHVAWMGCMALAAAAPPALGQARPAEPVNMADAFDNTIVSHYPDGVWVKHFFEPDGRYVATFSDGRRWTAHWSAQSDRVCLSQIRPRQLLPRFCTRMVAADVGDSWRSRDPLGRTVRNELVAGRPSSF